MTAVLCDMSEVTASVIVTSCVIFSGPFHIDDSVVAYTDRLFNLVKDCTVISHWVCCPRTTEVTFEGVVTKPRDVCLSQLSRWRFLPQCLNMFQTDFSLVAVVRDAFTASSLAGAVITRETVFSSGTATTSSTGATLVCIPREVVW